MLNKLKYNKMIHYFNIYNHKIFFIKYNKNIKDKFI